MKTEQKTKQKIAALASAAQLITTVLDHIETASEQVRSGAPAVHDELFKASVLAARDALQDLRLDLMFKLRDLGAIATS